MDALITKTRHIVLDSQEFAFPFDSPSGTEQLMECTVIKGAGTVTLYEISNEERSQVGDSHYLSRDPNDAGKSFYIALKTPKRKSKWEIAFRGTGSFKLKFPDLEDDSLYPKRVIKTELTEDDERGRSDKSHKEK